LIIVSTERDATFTLDESWPTPPREYLAREEQGNESAAKRFLAAGRLFQFLGSGTPLGSLARPSKTRGARPRGWSRKAVSFHSYNCDIRYVAFVTLGYARVSTVKQDLDRQVEALAEAGIARERIYVDKKSGATVDRPGLRAVLE
jgi:hypothetical protein